MISKVTKSLVIKKTHIVDSELLKSIENILLQYSKYTTNTTISYSITDNKNTEYSFDNLDDLLSQSKNILNKFIELNISCRYAYIIKNPYSYASDSYSITFSNDPTSFLSSDTKIFYAFEATENYQLINNALQDLLRNKRTIYSRIARVNITLITSLFIYLILLFKIRSLEQPAPLIIKIRPFLAIPAGIPYFITLFSKRCQDIKTNLFPRNEFHIGSNIKREIKYKKYRNTILAILSATGGKLIYDIVMLLIL